MASRLSSRQSTFRRWWAAVLIIAMILAPAVMHAGPAQASPADHHGGHAMPVAGSHVHGGAGSMASDDGTDKAASGGMGACLFCVVCAGALDLAPSLALPTRRTLSFSPAIPRPLLARELAPGSRPPLI